MLTRPTPLVEVAHACDLSGFSCGETSLDDWLKGWARKYDDHGDARTYVVRAGERVVAYYCLAAGHVERDHLPSKLRPHGTPRSVPVLVLGRLAVDRAFQGHGLGQDLLSHCFQQCLAAANHIGTRGLVVHPLSDRAVRFYEAAQFQMLPGEPHAMFISLKAIRAAMAAGPVPPR